MKTPSRQKKFPSHSKAKNPVTAPIEFRRLRAAYKVIEGAVMWIAANASKTTALSISLNDKFTYHFREREHLVSEADLIAYGNHLRAFGIIGKTTKANGCVTYYLTQVGLKRLQSRTFSSLEYKSVYSPDPVTLKKPKILEPGRPGPQLEATKKVALTAEIHSKQTGSKPAVPTDLPLASDMCWPMLTAICGRAMKMSLAIGHAADALSFDKNFISVPIPFNTNQTFLSRAQVATQYLTENHYIKRIGKLLSTTPKGDRLVGSCVTPVSWSGFKEPRLKIKPTRLLNLSVEGRKAYLSINSDVEKVLQSLAEIENHKIVTIWQNAVRLLADPAKQEEFHKAHSVLDAVSLEWDRRAKLSTVDGRFKWPSTEARGGDGNLRFDKSQPEGMLAYLEYRVGRTNGHHSPVRQSTLSRIFEGSLPPVFEKAYMDQWGANQSAGRLRKMAESLAAFARNAKRRDDERLDEAIRQWEQDLKFLHDRYYVEKFFFGWPATAVEGPSLPMSLKR